MGVNATPPFVTDTIRRDRSVLITLTGELDIATAPALVDAVEAAPPEERLVLDLRGLAFMDSSGVRVLMALDLRSRSEDWELVIARNPGPVARLLDVCRLGDRIALIDDPAEVFAP